MANGVMGGPTGVSAELADTEHGSAADSLPRISDVAAGDGPGTPPRIVPPLGDGNINDDTVLVGKRRVVSRDQPAALPGAMLPATLRDLGAADRSLELSSDVSVSG